ncbi:MAG TPA: glycine oxidase ThiO [Bryobacteraceae bacterium]
MAVGTMIVAGAGIIGLSCAWRLARCGIRVTVFDAREAGGEASWAGAGMLAPGGEMDEASPLTTMALGSLQIYPEFVESLREASGVPIDYQRCGALQLALDDHEAEDLERRAARQSAIGIRSESARHADSAAARHYPDDALVNPRDLIAALRVACMRSGVSIRENEPVIEIFPNGSGVRTARDRYFDDGVLISAGAWSSELASCFRTPAVTPVRGHLIAYEAKPGMLGTILRHQHTYLLQRDSGSLIAGSSTERVGFDRTIDEGIVGDIHVRASRLMPQLASMDPVASWNGFRPCIEGGIPAIGRIEDAAIWTAFGHYRNGILLAPDTALRIGQLVTQAQ